MQHVSHFESSFSFYLVDVHEVDICTVAENWSVNMQIADLTSILSVARSSRKFNLEVQDMIRTDTMLNCTTSSSHNTMLRTKE